jgi:hypothetical protein
MGNDHALGTGIGRCPHGVAHPIPVGRRQLRAVHGHQVDDVDVEAGGEVGSAAAGTAHAVGTGARRYRAAGGDDGEAAHSRIIPNRGDEAAPNQAAR